MGIIEQAVHRLEELRRSGIEVPPASGGRLPLKPAETFDPLPARAVRRMQEAAASTPGAAPVSDALASAPLPSTQPLPPATSADIVQSRQVHIDRARLDAMGYLSADKPHSQLASEFRVIKRTLLSYVRAHAGVPGKRSNLIMVTSSMPSEGKTFVSVNLAMSIAMEVDKRVLLVDADVSRPAVLGRLGIDGRRGLLDLLADPTRPMSEMLLRTDIDKLTVLPSGPPNGRATEMIASNNMTALLDELATRYDDRVVIFDAPPLLVSTESCALTTQMGQVLLVVQAERTPQKSVEQSLAILEPCPVVVQLLNRVRNSEVGSYYGYYGPPGN